MKRLWVNGDSHTAGTYSPHDVKNPFAKQLAQKFNLEYTNIALPGGSNHRIIRTTIEALPDLDPADTFILIGWSSWGRTEWYWDHEWHAICGDPGYNIPYFAQQRWKLYSYHHKNQFADPVSDHDLWSKSKEQEHAIYVFHKLLTNLGYKFLFFLACANNFRYEITDSFSSQLPWTLDAWAHDPYSSSGFSYFCDHKGHKKDHGWHYGQAAHDDYAEFLVPLLSKKLL